jgi:cell wall-associated NlpC family hydrolase
MKRRSNPILFLLLALWLSGCFKNPEVIRDIRLLPQDNLFYLDPATANREMATPEQQQEFQQNFRGQFFMPWRQTAPSNTREDYVGEFVKFRSYPGYGENSRRHSVQWLKELAQNADLAAYPNTGFKAITVHPSDLRLLPTLRPHFSSLKADGTGYPFDNLQNSSIPASTPIYVAHIARDRSWVLAESHYGAGWLPVRDVAAVDAKLMALWEGADHVAITKDAVPVHDESGRFLFKAGLGSQFPKLNADAGDHRIAVAQADEHRAARVGTALIPKDSAVSQPLMLTPSAIARLANELMNTPYGWGGLYQNRDCSSLLKDLFVPFGLWLPRHSSHQALAGGVLSDLSSLAPEERERLILQHGVPFLTLIWLRGHIMLYIANFQGRALVFHELWGIKTRSLWGEEGRKIVGHSAITTLHPGAELMDRELPSGDLLHRVEGMTVLGQGNR